MDVSILLYAIAIWRAAPGLAIEDAYKWLYHATLGGDHAVTSDDGPRRWMDREWATLGNPLPGEPLVQKLDSGGKLIRVNLRPYKAQGGDKEMLLALFVASAKQFKPEKSRFEQQWRELGSALKQKSIGNLTYPAWVRLDRETKALGYPAIEHSGRYLKRDKPAYRVILGELWIGKR